MPEALETWPVSLFEKLLPRHLQIRDARQLKTVKITDEVYPASAGPPLQGNDG
jgi:glucan phosphorylase